MDLHTAFRSGAQQLARDGLKYSEIHRAHGISQTDWELLTQDEFWTPEQYRGIRSLLANVVEVSMTVAGLPSVPLPGQYVAAVIAICVSPCNRIMAAQKAPDTFDAVGAAGITETFVVRPMPREQMLSLVMLYSGGYGGEPAMERLPADVVQMAKKEARQ